MHIRVHFAAMEPQGGEAMFRGATYELPGLVTLLQVIILGEASKASVSFSPISFHCITIFLTLLGFRNQGERTSGISGAVHKRAEGVPGVTEQVFRAVFRAYGSQVLSSQFPCFSSDPLPKLSPEPSARLLIPF